MFLVGLGSSLQSRHSTASQTGCQRTWSLHTKYVFVKIMISISVLGCLHYPHSSQVHFFLLAMAFITYILLAGMALGIQKRWVMHPSAVYIMIHSKYVCVKCVWVNFVCVKVQSRGSWAVCQYCPRVDHNRSAGDAVKFVPVGRTQRPLNLRSHRLQRLQICWVIRPQTWWFVRPYIKDV